MFQFNRFKKNLNITQTVKLPTSVTNLYTSLTNMNWNTLSHFFVLIVLFDKFI